MKGCDTYFGSTSFVVCNMQCDSRLKKPSRYGETGLIVMTMHGSHGFHATVTLIIDDYYRIIDV